MTKVIKKVVDDKKKSQTITMPKGSNVVALKVVKTSVVIYAEIDDTQVDVQDFSFRVFETDEAFTLRNNETHIGMIEMGDKEFHVYQTVNG